MRCVAQQDVGIRRYHTSIVSPFSLASSTIAAIDSIVRLGMNISNAPDAIRCSMYVCGQVETVYQTMPEYGEYHGFNVRTASWVKECSRLVDFRVRVLVPLGKRFENTPLPQANSITNVHGTLFGRDKATDTIIIMVKGFSILPGSSSNLLSASSVETSATPKTPHKKGRCNLHPVTPSPTPVVARLSDKTSRKCLASSPNFTTKAQVDTACPQKAMTDVNANFQTAPRRLLGCAINQPSL